MSGHAQEECEALRQPPRQFALAYGGKLGAMASRLVAIRAGFLAPVVGVQRVRATVGHPSCPELHLLAAFYH
jgi:hypothetical protein